MLSLREVKRHAPGHPPGPGAEPHPRLLSLARLPPTRLSRPGAASQLPVRMLQNIRTGKAGGGSTRRGSE